MTGNCGRWNSVQRTLFSLLFLDLVIVDRELWKRRDFRVRNLFEDAIFIVKFSESSDSLGKRTAAVAVIR
jgi:hypothetical protein